MTAHHHLIINYFNCSKINPDDEKSLSSKIFHDGIESIKKYMKIQLSDNHQNSQLFLKVILYEAKLYFNTKKSSPIKVFHSLTFHMMSHKIQDVE